jgi:hypothetical protein
VPLSLARAELGAVNSLSPVRSVRTFEMIGCGVRRGALPRVLGGTRIAVPEDDVVQPVRDNALGVHELAYGLEYGLEVILLGLAAHYDVVALVDVLPAVAGVVHVNAILIRVEPDAVGAGVAGEDRTGLRAVLDHSSVRVQHTLDLATPDRRQSDLWYEGQLVVVLGACGGTKIAVSLEHARRLYFRSLLQSHTDGQL